MRLCSLPECRRVHYAKTYCRMHWERNHNNGAPVTRVVPPGTPTAHRLAYYSERRGDCLVYTGHLDRYGYGQITIDGKGLAVHRVAYELAHGPIPAGLMIRHKCDNPPCIDPDHLEVGTNRDNCNDKVLRGRSPKGERNPGAKLTEAQVQAIQDALAQGKTQVHLAKVYRVGRTTIGRIQRGESWKHMGVNT